MAAAEAFNVEKLLSLLRTCRGEKNEILIDMYVDAYEELGKLLVLFGSVFGFVNSDVTSKVEILRAYRSSGQSENFDSIKSMLDYEVKNNLTARKDKPSGSRTLLRLHRALEFIVQILEEICKGDKDTKMATVSLQAYNRTLAKYHPWLIRKGVHISFYTLPGRTQLLQRMQLLEEERAQAVLKEIISLADNLYTETQVLYADRNLLDLP
ncbi:ceramide-1-phosphate transfer protein-like [Haliotis rufescens]|uniref:ceramide-1-phosphate transfer protein-like n=1 Tax=Haliotis rufescens TaxID=6454 RepID=UPI00201F9008|nr:ceramide-1-phosphate transfer protein-like [Haliotis rufescens]